VFIAALSSQVSALEPLIAHAQEKWNLKRKVAAVSVVFASFLLGTPSALSTSIFSWTFMDQNFLELASFVTTSILIPLGGLFAVLLIGRKLGIAAALQSIHEEDKQYLQKHRLLFYYLKISIAYTAPILIFLVLLHALGCI
jgi:NSS family neurotransmitter:Na+ symporter